MIADAVPWYLSPNFLPAAFGLLGVIVGGLITAVSSYLLDERRSEREQEREKRDRLIEIKRAARMIDADLSEAGACAMVACQQNHYWDSPNAPLKVKGWENYAAIIAPAVSSDEWLKICIGFDAVRSLNDYREMDASSASGQLFPPVSESLRRGVENALTDIIAAREALAPLCFESRGAVSGS